MTANAVITPTWHQSRSGRRPNFPSAASADAYDRGFARYPLALPADVPSHCPEASGWRDHESQRRDVAMRAAFEAADDLADWAVTNRQVCGVRA